MEGEFWRSLLRHCHHLNANVSEDWSRQLFVVWCWSLILTSPNSCGSPAGSRRGRSGSFIACSRQRCVLSISPRGKRFTNFYASHKSFCLIFAIMLRILLLFVYVLRIEKLEQKSLLFLVLHKFLSVKQMKQLLIFRYFYLFSFVIVRRQFSSLIVQMIDASSTAAKNQMQII